MEEKQDLLKFVSEENDGIDEKEDGNEDPEFSFTFKFPTFEEFGKTQKNLSQFLNFKQHIDAPKVSLDDSKVHTNSNGGLVSHECRIPEFGIGYVHVSHDDPGEDDFQNQEYVLEKLMVDGLNLKNIVEKEKIYTSSEESLQKTHDNSVYSSSHSNRDSNVSNNLHLPTTDVQLEDVFLSGENNIKEKEKIITFSEEKLQKVHDESIFSSPDSDMFSIGSYNFHSPTFDLHLEDGFLADGYFELKFNVEDENEQNKVTQSDFLSENDFGVRSGNENVNKLSNDASNKLESMREHQELIDQLKMEIKNIKAIGLPTIFEESESPLKIMEDLKPWKIEEVCQNSVGKTDEVHKFYKSYRERMRKFDIFSCQKMYAIGFLQLKDPLESSTSSISSFPESSTLFTRSFTINKDKSKKHEINPKMKFIQELQSDLEIVYVGQMCLSWEILHWQYEKALDIWECDQHGVRRFNDIAGEFQQFQVLIQRFIEDEPFQGPRIQNYVKTRCVYRNLLQVPVIRDDHLNNKKARSEVVYDITSDALVEILEESIRIFWRFLCADKHKRQTPVEFQRPEDSQIFLDLQKDLHKKEMKLKEKLRNGNSILKKLRCREDEKEDQVIYFFCQVDMKLVSRVLQMSKLTSDQLQWCHNKLSKVSFINRKIHIEPSFLLFPC